MYSRSSGEFHQKELFKKSDYFRYLNIASRLSWPVPPAGQPVQHPPRIHPGPDKSRCNAKPANPDTAVIPDEEDLRTSAGNDEVNQDQGFGADEKGADTCEDIKIPP